MKKMEGNFAQILLHMVFFRENREDAVHPVTGRFRKKRKASADMRLSAVQTRYRTQRKRIRRQKQCDGLISTTTGHADI